MEIKLATSDFAIALAVAVMAGAAAWRPGSIPVWLAALPVAALVANYVASGVYQLLIAHAWLKDGRSRGPYAELEAHEQATWGETAWELDVLEKESRQAKPLKEES
jgi:hypothetical protein